jgi:UDP:flavonoid glycosyltransferase YjiC (YdhE family)
MKVLCSFVGGAGHLIPQLPLLRALRDAGHDLSLVGRESAVRSAPGEIFDRVVTRTDRRATISNEIAPLVPVDIAAELSVVSDYFAGRAARESAAALLTETGGADLVVCDELDFGAMAAADRAGVPVVVVAVIASGALVRTELVEPALVATRSQLGLSGPARPRGDLFVIPFAPAMRNPEFPAPEDAMWMRPQAGASPASDGSIVATLGTEFNTESGDLFDRILDAVGELDAPTTVAVGRDVDPARFGPQPAHIRVERYVDLGTLLPKASVVLHHGGSGLFLSAVLAGAPQLVFPMGADQPFTAERIEQLGIGRAENALAVTPSAIRAAIQNLRNDDKTRQRVAALRGDTLQLPEPSEVVSRLEALADGPRA